jgi:hypothetical protein
VQEGDRLGADRQIVERHSVGDDPANGRAVVGEDGDGRHRGECGELGSRERVVARATERRVADREGVALGAEDEEGHGRAVCREGASFLRRSGGCDRDADWSNPVHRT